MPRNPSTGVFTRVSNSFSEPVMGTLIDPIDAIAYFDDVDGGLSFDNPTFVGTETINSGAATALVVNTTATANALTVNAQGDVGVGVLLTPDPTHHLSFEIQRSTNLDAAQTIRNRNDGALARAVWHGFAGTTDQVDGSISVASPVAGGYVNWRTGGTTGGFNLIQSANDVMTFHTNNLPAFRLTADGVHQFDNANNFSANGAVATSLGSVGPTGARTTVQKWLKILDASGNPFYIALF